MKTLTSIYANSNEQDAIIEHFPKTFKTTDSKVVWVDEKNCIALCHQEARTITIYVKDYENFNEITVVTLSAQSVERLHDLITQIEKQTSEEFID